MDGLPFLDIVEFENWNCVVGVSWNPFSSCTITVAQVEGVILLRLLLLLDIGCMDRVDCVCRTLSGDCKRLELDILDGGVPLLIRLDREFRRDPLG